MLPPAFNSDGDEYKYDQFEYEREDFVHCLENSLVAFSDDLKTMQYCIDREEARRVVFAHAPMHTKRADSQDVLAERRVAQTASREDLQARLASKLSRK